MPNTSLKKRPQVAAIKHPDSGTTFYSDPTLKTDPDAKGIRLAVGARQKVWWVSRRIEGKLKQVRLGEWPMLPTVYDARDIAKAKMNEIATSTDAASTNIATLSDALESAIRNSDAKPETHDYYRAQVARHMATLFARPIESVNLEMLEAALRGQGVATATHLKQIIRMAFKRAAVVRRMYDLSSDLKVVGAKNYQPDNEVLFDVNKPWPALDVINECTNVFIRSAWLLMLFTGLRSKNVIELEWSHVDLDEKTLIVDRLKNGRATTFPLSDRACEALHAVPRSDRFVFPAASRSGHIYSLSARALDGKKILRQHDCRRLFTTAARRERLPTYIIDQLRGDTSKGVQDIYDQGSMTHEDASRVARRIEIECRTTTEITPN